MVFENFLVENLFVFVEYLCYPAIKNFLVEYLFVFVESLCYRSPKMRTKV